jgi:hypothetical protein
MAAALAEGLNYHVALLAEAVEVGRPAARYPHPMQIPSLLNLIRHLRELSYIRNDMNLLREAETAARWAIQLTAKSDADDRSVCLLELARTLETIYHRTRELTYLQEAVEAADGAVRLTQDPIPRHLRGMIASNIAKQLKESTDQGVTTERSITPPPPPLIR